MKKKQQTEYEVELDDGEDVRRWDTLQDAQADYDKHDCPKRLLKIVARWNDYGNGNGSDLHEERTLIHESL